MKGLGVLPVKEAFSRAQRKMFAQVLAEIECQERRGFCVQGR
jgi:hypothetical protein